MLRIASISLLFVVACSGDEGSDPLPTGECPMADTADAGDLTALKSQRCNVPGSMGASHWYRLSATLPEQIVQLELWDNRGPFEGGAVKTGTFTIAGKDLSPATCGVCLRAMTDKGTPDERELFATGGTVEVTAVSPDMDTPFVATITNATFDQVDPTAKTPISDGCTSSVAHVKVTGTMEIKGGGGTSGGGGGGGGGTNGCVKTIGD